MVSGRAKEWIAAAIELGNNADATVLCPQCHQDRLHVQDLYYNSKPSERRLYCPACGAENYLLFSSSGSGQFGPTPPQDSRQV